MPADRIRVRIDGRELELSNLDKVLYPAVGFTKGEVIDYYSRIAPVALPHLRDRALTRIRFPNGVEEKSFFEKNAPAHTPEWVRVETLPAPGSTKDRETINYVVADDLPTLVWLANLAAIELHTPQWRIGAPPDLMVVDLDPGPGVAWRECCAVAVVTRDRLAEDGLRCYPKTSGKKGMQLYCPIAGIQSAEHVSRYAQRVARELERAYPDLIVSRMAKKLRTGKVFIDWSPEQRREDDRGPVFASGPARPVGLHAAHLGRGGGRHRERRGGAALQPRRGAVPRRGARGPARPALRRRPRAA